MNIKNSDNYPIMLCLHNMEISGIHIIFSLWRDLAWEKMSQRCKMGVQNRNNVLLTSENLLAHDGYSFDITVFPEEAALGIS